MNRQYWDLRERTGIDPNAWRHWFESSMFWSDHKKRIDTMHEQELEKWLCYASAIPGYEESDKVSAIVDGLQEELWAYEYHRQEWEREQMAEMWRREAERQYQEEQESIARWHERNRS